MSDSTDEILERINARLAERKDTGANGNAPNVGANNIRPDNAKGARRKEVLEENQRQSSTHQIRNQKPVSPQRSLGGSEINNPVTQLSPDQIASPVYIIAPTQIEYVAEVFGNLVADGMNMRAFAPKLKALAAESLETALKLARKQGAN